MPEISKCFDYDTAEKLRLRFKYLSGKPFGKQTRDAQSLIHAVVIIPGNDLHQVMFLKEYEETKSLDTAMSIQEWLYYDVAVLTHSSLQPFKAKLKSLRQYLIEMELHIELFTLSPSFQMA